MLEAAPPTDAENWPFFCVLSYSMGAGLGLDKEKWRRSSWRNSDLAAASAEKNKNHPFTVKNIEAWKNGTDVPDLHFETLLAVLTDDEPSGSREKWRHSIRRCRDVDANRSRASRRKAYRLFQKGTGQFGAGVPGALQVPSASLLFGHGELANGFDLPLLVSHLSDLGARPQIYERLHNLLVLGKSNIFETFAMELDDFGLLSNSWQLRRFFAKSLAAQLLDADNLVKHSLFSDLANFKSGPQLAPLLVGPIIQIAPTKISDYLRNLPSDFRENPQLSWELHRNTVDKSELAEGMPALTEFREFYAEFTPPQSTRTLTGKIEYLLTTVKGKSGLSGRYGFALEILQTRLIAMNNVSRYREIYRLCESKNEGVRWCVVKCLSDLSSTNSLTQLQYSVLVRKLSMDNNPWVLRELCDFLASVDFDVSDDAKKDILINIQTSIRHHSNNGVPSEATLPSFLKLLQRWPTMLYLFRLEMS